MKKRKGKADSDKFKAPSPVKGKMERGKTSQGRGAKSKTQQYPADLYALGSKSSRIEGSEAKRAGVVHGKPGPSHSFPSSDRKREAVGGPLAAIVPPKKPKVGAPSILGRVGGSGSSGGAEAWEMVAVECEPSELVPAVLEACNMDEGDKEVSTIHIHINLNYIHYVVHLWVGF
ncbi:hypothetical protein C0J52_18279 [Blattella germanica]|nr:hypothetical protein C0J52_18279 [Blattella germanica]